MATSPAGSDVLSQLVGAGKRSFCERFGVRLLTSYGMTETIWALSAIALAINGAGRRLVGRLLLRSGDPRRSQSSPPGW